MIHSRASRLRTYTPLRYPGGKGKIAPFIKEVLKVNNLVDGTYIEPYAGGAAIACELLIKEYVSEIYINDLSRPVWAFWNSVLNNTEALLRLIRNVRLSVSTWDRQKRVFAKASDHNDLELGFAAFYLNRTNRSGIFNGGIIGGRAQDGEWKIDARFNKPELMRRIETIARFRNNVHLSNEDAFVFLRRGLQAWPKKSLIYLDPPYYVKGQALYFNAYAHEDHKKIAALVKGVASQREWLVSYDNVPAVRTMFADSRRIEYSLAYSAREYRRGKEIMFFSDSLIIPPHVSAMATPTRQRS